MRETRRYKFKNKVKIVDLGFRFADITGLEREQTFDKGSVSARRANLKLNGATPEEIEILLHERVELNVLPSAKLVAFVERKFKEHSASPRSCPPPRRWRKTYRHLAGEPRHREEAQA